MVSSGLLHRVALILTRATRRNNPEDTILYKNSVRTSQETHYITATEPSRLMLCKISDFHAGDYVECRIRVMCRRVTLVRTYISEKISFLSSKTPWPLVRERTIPTDRPPLVDEI
jgi:hypothetical protein